MSTVTGNESMTAEAEAEAQGATMPEGGWPVVPRKGGLILLMEEVADVAQAGTLFRFQRFDGDKITGTVHAQPPRARRSVGREITVPVDRCKVAVPLVPDETTSIENPVKVVTIAQYDYHAGTVLECTGWRGVNPLIREVGLSRQGSAVHPQYYAAMRPILDPSTESITEKVARLEREAVEREDRIQARMVAEATARSWCSDYDNVAQGMGWRRRDTPTKVRVVAAIDQEIEVNPRGMKGEALAAAIKESPWSYMNYSNIKFETVEVPVVEPEPPLITFI